MKIAIIGYGKMGKIIEEKALCRGHQIVWVVDPLVKPGVSQGGAPILESIAQLPGPPSADIAIEFTRPDTAVANIKALTGRNIPLVVGTTGWYGALDEVRAAVQAAGSCLLYSPNFSLGVNLFYRIASCAAKIIDPYPEYDAAGFEAHHNKKADSPSGTAKTLVEKVLSEMTRKKTPVWETLNRPPEPEELHFPSLRIGAYPGVHSLIFDSAADTIEITHTTRNREGLASGAILAAEWLAGKGISRKGVFTFEDVLGIA
ncbi:MAG: 4-hydroxy-tetrahydrodipicolinate reductase [Treponema sp.]|jgi:4-hydroxy-tetrahydrodipicolinate reductase|nr:4-hydroxy-tetrahydrodipicolinate reductase [Treponema sp.]